MFLNKIFLLLTLIFFVDYSQSSVKNEKQSNVPIVNGRKLPWVKFYLDYIENKSPVIFQGAFRDNTAYKTWTVDYVLHHPGTALTFCSFFDEQTVSFRKMVLYRHHFVRIFAHFPLALRKDLTLPKCLDCDLILKEILPRPIWFWNLNDWTERSVVTDTHELWCVIRGKIKFTLLPEWTIKMIGRDVEELIDPKSADFNNDKFYKAELKEGDCLYTPNEFLRQIEHRQDSIGAVFLIRDGLPLEEIDHEYCQSLGDGTTLDKIDFDEDSKLQSVEDAWALELFMNNLNEPSRCIDRLTFLDLHNIPLLVDEVKMLGYEEIFELMDVDQDGKFCWTDIDSMSMDKARQVATGVATRLVLMFGKEILVKNATLTAAIRARAKVGDEL